MQVNKALNKTEATSGEAKKPISPHMSLYQIGSFNNLQLGRNKSIEKYMCSSGLQGLLIAKSRTGTVGKTLP